MNPENRPEWLEIVAKSAKSNRWILYKYKSKGTLSPQ